MDSDEEVGSASGGGAEDVRTIKGCCMLHCVVPDTVGADVGRELLDAKRAL